MRRLFRNVVSFGIIGILPITGEGFTQNGVQRFLDSATSYQYILIFEANIDMVFRTEV